jgi:hypothetical protein
VKIGPLDSEHAGGAGDVPVGLLESLEYGFALGGIPGPLKVRGCCARRSHAYLERNGRLREAVLRRKDGHTFDGVLQFTDISRPGITFEDWKDVIAERLPPEIVPSAEFV